MTSGYHRDLQLIKEPLFRALDNAADVLLVLHRALSGVQFDRDRTTKAMDSGLFATQPTPLARMLMDVVKRAAAQHNREADAAVESCEADVVISAQNLDKVLGEVIDNAFKFSQSGTGVRVDARVEGPVAVISIRDEGRGMDAAALATTRSLEQMERFSTQRTESGLGLAIAMRMTEIHNGRLYIGECEGPGTRVCIELPVAGAEP
jgi:signal transduction histidine kinase